MDTINTVFLEGLVIVVGALFTVSGKVFRDGFLFAFKEAKSDLSTVFLNVQEMLTHSPKVVTYIGSTGPLKECQHVVGRVGILVIVSLFDIG